MITNRYVRSTSGEDVTLSDESIVGAIPVWRNTSSDAVRDELVAGTILLLETHAAEALVTLAHMTLNTGSVDTGEKADEAATTDSGTFSLIALFKRLLGKFRLGQGTMAQSLAVTVASDQSDVPVVLKGSNVDKNTVTIANAASLSGVYNFAGKTLEGIHMSALWTTANLTFSVSEDGVTYDNLYDRFGTEVNYSAAAARYIAIPPSDWHGIQYIKVRSGTAGSPVAQGADRVITLVFKAV